MNKMIKTLALTGMMAAFAGGSIFAQILTADDTFETVRIAVRGDYVYVEADDGEDVRVTSDKGKVTVKSSGSTSYGPSRVKEPEKKVPVKKEPEKKTPAKKEPVKKTPVKNEAPRCDMVEGYWITGKPVKVVTVNPVTTKPGKETVVTTTKKDDKGKKDNSTAKTEVTKGKNKTNEKSKDKVTPAKKKSIQEYDDTNWVNPGLSAGKDKNNGKNNSSSGNNGKHNGKNNGKKTGWTEDDYIRAKGRY